MKNILLRAVVVLAAAAAVGCGGSPDPDEQTIEPAALAGSDTIDQSSPPVATAGEPDEAADALPPTASVLPLTLAIGSASLGTALVLRRVRRAR